MMTTGIVDAEFVIQSIEDVVDVVSEWPGFAERDALLETLRGVEHTLRATIAELEDSLPDPEESEAMVRRQDIASYGILFR
jgi:hypothetical protein